MSPSKLPVLPLPYPLVLLPVARFTLPVSRETGNAILELIEQSDTLPIVAAVPMTSNPEGSSEPSKLSEWATATRILRLVRPPSRGARQPYLVSLHGLTRVRLTKPTDSYSPLSIHPIEYPLVDKELVPTRDVVDKFRDSAVGLLDRLASDSGSNARRAEEYNRIVRMLDDITDARAAWMADVLMSTINAEHADRLAILNAADPTTRLTLATEIFLKQTSITEVSKKIASAVDESLSKQQKEFFLRQQLAAIQRELQSLSSSSSSDASSSDSSSELDDDEKHDADDLADIKRKIEAMEKGSEERKMGVREWRRLKRIPPGSVENGVIRSYLEWLTAIPWSNSPLSSTSSQTTSAFLSNARAQLDADHFGLEKVKKRLIEYLAVVKLKEISGRIEEKAVIPFQGDKKPDGTAATTPSKKRNVRGPILLFVGPPGTGKTSLGQSIAKALDRPFQRVSLGGVRDEAEIRGHRRTYVASGPGLIVQALRRAGRRDPVIVLDEIDKIGHNNFHGDPGAALLEVLDPEQNHSFNDHYINVPVDLSQVLFICTANSLDTISAPLLDRCEVIQLSGYTYDEKMHIARRFLLPKQLDSNGLATENLTLTEPALLRIATHYTREAGVRSLERAIGGVVRYKAVEWAESLDTSNSSGKKDYNGIVEEDDLERILGLPRWDGEEKEREARRGVVYGLVVMGQGEGGILPVETIAVPGKGHVKLTGSLGDVIKESAELALSWVRRHAYDLCITNSRSQDPLMVPDGIDIHLHLPAGAQKKDGPSAGVAMTCAFVSLLTGACVPPNVAMTGEITLRGRVAPVGGIKEKVLGAHRAQATKVILPYANRKDVEHDVAMEIRNEMEFVFVKTVREALDAAFGRGVLAWRHHDVLMESRL